MRYLRSLSGSFLSEIGSRGCQCGARSSHCLVAERHVDSPRRLGLFAKSYYSVSDGLISSPDELHLVALLNLLINEKA